MSTNSKKDNFNQAMYEMFGVGKNPEEQAAADEYKDAEYTESAADTGSAVTVKKLPLTYIAEGTVFEGIIRSEGDVEIAGSFKGDIYAEGKVVARTSIEGNISAKGINVIGCQLKGDIVVEENIDIDVNAVITGNIKAENLTCAGQIEGDVVAGNNVALEATSKVIGNITTGALSVARGAVIKGTLEIK